MLFDEREGQWRTAADLVRRRFIARRPAKEEKNQICQLRTQDVHKYRRQAGRCIHAAIHAASIHAASTRCARPTKRAWKICKKILANGTTHCVLTSTQVSTTSSLRASCLTGVQLSSPLSSPAKLSSSPTKGSSNSTFRSWGVRSSGGGGDWSWKSLACFALQKK